MSSAALLSIIAGVATICWPILRLLRRLYDVTVQVVFSTFFYFRKRIPLPPVFNPALLLSATQLAKGIRDRRMTSVSVVRAYISRTSDVNPILNALAQEVFREALQEALRVDDRILQGYKNGTLTPEWLEKNEPFLGVPFTVKESISAEDMLQTGGLISRRNTVATRDAHVVESMKEAGAILLATTNVAELGMWWESENRLYGTTCNPYDPRRTPGGSSGGETALMCACGSPLSLGSDVGGSLRTPAFFCGLFSHKPSPGLISLQGVGLLPSPQPNPVLAVGPITRHSEDLLPLLKVLSRDSACAAEINLDEPVNLGLLKVYSIADDGGGVLTSEVCSELRAAQKAVANYFIRTHDIQVQELRLPALAQSYSVWKSQMREVYKNSPGMLMQLGDNQGEINVWKELVRAVLGRANHTWPSLLQAAGEKLLPPSDEGDAEANHRWRSLLSNLQRILGSNGVLLYPSHPTLAPYHRQPLAYPLNFTYTAIFNALGLPVTQVPLGLTEAGLPLGVQVVGGQNMDRLTVAVAAELEKGFGGWRCPAEIL